jgi:hypothetical protein
VILGQIQTPKPGGPFEKSLAVLERLYPRTRSDVKDGLDKLLGLVVPSPPNVVAVPGVGRTILKVRVASSDMQRGKSGGFRVLLDHRGDDKWCPVLVYAKTKKSNVSPADILKSVLESE